VGTEAARECHRLSKHQGAIFDSVCDCENSGELFHGSGHRRVARQQPLAGASQIVIDQGLHGIDRCIGVRRLTFARIPMMSVVLRTHALDVRRHTAGNVFA